MKIKRIIATTVLIIASSLAFSQSVDDSLYYDGSYKLSESLVDGLGNQFIDVFSYNIEYLQIIPKKKLIRANTKIKIKSDKNLTSFYLDFHNSYKIQSLKVNGISAEWRFNHGHNLFIKPKVSLPKNNFFTVEIKYFNTDDIFGLWDNSVYEGNFIFAELPNYLLFPSNEILNDRAYYNFNISMPSDYKLVSFGKQVKKTKNNYAVSSKTTLSINNFTLNLLNNYSSFSMSGPRISYGALASKVTINQFTPIDSTVVFKNLIKKVPKQMAYLDSILGYYPYKNFNILITKKIIKQGVFNSRNTIILPYAFTIDTIEVNNKILNGLVNQWFGNKLSVKDSKDIWITKGFSKYMEWLIIEQEVGKAKFNKMMNSKLVEARKYMGMIDWHQMNPDPIYMYDLSNVVHDFGELSKEKNIKGDEISFLFKVISLDTETVSDTIKSSFRNRFGHDIDVPCENGHSYYDVMEWAKNQNKGSFRISADGFYTLKSMQSHEFKTHIFKLADPGKEYLNDMTIATRGALFVHSLRLYFGDDLFFSKVLEFASRYSGAAMSTEFFISEFNESTNGDIDEVVNKWLYSDSEIPVFQSLRKEKVLNSNFRLE